MTFRVVVLCLIIILLSSLSFAERPNLDATKTADAPKIDGILDDGCWKALKPVTDFYFLADGSKAEEETVAWICYDDKAVYVAFECKDSQPDKVVTQQTKRGGSMGMDDRVELDIDCYGNANADQIAWFQATARGTQREQLQSGDATKIEWKGDWTAAASRNSVGYNVEFKIPFSILQYNAKNPNMCIMLARYHARTSKWWIAPNLGTSGDPRFYYSWRGIESHKFHDRPLLMLSSILTGGSNSNSIGVGADIKYSFTPDMTGVATINPDFRNVEQDVGTTDYTYTERYIADARPFFQQGSAYLPGSDIFYTTKRIADVNYGVKLTGNYGGYNIGLINVNERDSSQATAIKISRDLNGLGQLSVASALSAGTDLQLNSTQMNGNYLLYEHGDNRLNVSASYGMADVNTSAGVITPKASAFGLSYGGGIGAWTWSIGHRAVDPLYQPVLGIEQENDLSAWSIGGSLYNEFSTGAVCNRSVGLNLSATDHTDGSKYYDALGAYTDCTWRNGTYASLGLSLSNRVELGSETEFRDRTGSVSYGWGNRSLYRRGGVGIGFGRLAGGDYLSYSVSQGYDLSRRLSMMMSYQYTQLSEPSPSAYSASQWITRFTYDLNIESAISGRIFQSGKHTNAYLAYRRRVRKGTDVYIILGDPNSQSTQSRFSIKLVRLM